MNRKLIQLCSGGCLFALLLTTALTGCGSREPKPQVKLSYDAASDSLTDAENGISYQWASASYEPAAVGDPYAVWDDMVLYEVDGWNPRKLLTEQFEGIGGLLYASDSPLPPLAEFHADEAIVCTAADVTIGLVTIDDAAVVEEMVTLLETGEQAELPANGATRYYFKLTSKDYAGIYYNLVYVAMGDEENDPRYLYDRSTKRCVTLPYDLLFGWVYSDEELPLPADQKTVIEEGSEAVISFDD